MVKVLFGQAVKIDEYAELLAHRVAESQRISADQVFRVIYRFDDADGAYKPVTQDNIAHAQRWVDFPTVVFDSAGPPMEGTYYPMFAAESGASQDINGFFYHDGKLFVMAMRVLTLVKLIRAGVNIQDGAFSGKFSVEMFGGKPYLTFVGE